MSTKIPFYFDPLPKYFRSAGWFRDFKTLAFVVWTFSRCSRDRREVIHDNQKIMLEPFSFIFGRCQCALETGLTEDEIRTRVRNFEKAGLLKKCPNKTPNRFTILKWVTDCFMESVPRQKPQEVPKRHPVSPHNKDIRYERRKEKEHHFLNDDMDFPKENILDFSNK